MAFFILSIDSAKNAGIFLSYAGLYNSWSRFNKSSIDTPKHLDNLSKFIPLQSKIFDLPEEISKIVV